jgi:hypothetical protein
MLCSPQNDCNTIHFFGRPVENSLCLSKSSDRYCVNLGQSGTDAYTTPLYRFLVGDKYLSIVSFPIGASKSIANAVPHLRNRPDLDWCIA